MEIVLFKYLGFQEIMYAKLHTNCEAEVTGIPTVCDGAKLSIPTEIFLSRVEPALWRKAEESFSFGLGDRLNKNYRFTGTDEMSLYRDNKFIGKVLLPYGGSDRIAVLFESYFIYDFKRQYGTVHLFQEQKSHGREKLLWNFFTHYDGLEKFDLEREKKINTAVSPLSVGQPFWDQFA